MVKKRILVAPLNWGLGHATRCIPIIKALMAHNFEPVIASDGASLQLLKSTFSELKFYELPSYNITYSKSAFFFQFKMLAKCPVILKAIVEEQKTLQYILKQESIHGIISDNRLGIRDKQIPSVYITHQVNILSGVLTLFASRLHQYYIKKFDACWVPDVEGHLNLSGALGHLKKNTLEITYIGFLSQFNIKKSEKKYDLLALVSGPEPQRKILADMFKKELKHFKGSVLLITGKIETEQTVIKDKNLTIYNYMIGSQLDHAINSSSIVVSRSGYTTLMDLSILKKPAFFIPTPGQYEQVYLAKKLEDQGIAPCCEQQHFNVTALQTIKNYKGLGSIESTSVLFGELFKFF